MSHEELVGFLVLILYKVKNKNPCSEKNLKNFGQGKYSKESSARTF